MSTADNELDKIDFEIITKVNKDMPGIDGVVVTSRIKLEAKAKQAIKDLIDKARIDELEQLQKKHTRTYRQTVTDNNGDVYVEDSHSYISKYETQERIAQLKGDK